MEISTSGKVRFQGLKSPERQRVRSELLQALEHIHRRRDFPLFVDLLTGTEQIMLSRRIRIAKQLMMGAGIREIRASCRAGQSTIESVDRWLQSRFKEYKETLSVLYAMMREDAKIAKKRVPIIPLSFRWIRQKYPMHFLIFNMLLNDIEWAAKSTNDRPRPYRPIRRKKSSHM